MTSEGFSLFISLFILCLPALISTLKREDCEGIVIFLLQVFYLDNNT